MKTLPQPWTAAMVATMFTGWIFIDRKTGQWRREGRGRVSGFIWGLWRAYGARILCHGFHTLTGVANFVPRLWR